MSTTNGVETFLEAMSFADVAQKLFWDFSPSRLMNIQIFSCERLLFFFVFFLATDWRILRFFLATGWRIFRYFLWLNDVFSGFLREIEEIHEFFTVSDWEFSHFIPQSTRLSRDFFHDRSTNFTIFSRDRSTKFFLFSCYRLTNLPIFSATDWRVSPFHPATYWRNSRFL